MENTVDAKQLSLALVHGEEIFDTPNDLYIPPDALEIFLENFEGPLDFLLYIIRKKGFNILELPIKPVTDQYVEYVKTMLALNLELASDYLVMAATLAEIKSRMLLPIESESEEDEEDPRAALINKLIEYETFKIAAEDISKLPREGRDTHRVTAALNSDCEAAKLLPEITLLALNTALNNVLGRVEKFKKHEIKREVLSTRSRMNMIITKLHTTNDYVPFEEFFTPEEGRQGVVVTFLAILELCKEKVLTIVQAGQCQPIHVKLANDDISLENVLR